MKYSHLLLIYPLVSSEVVAGRRIQQDAEKLLRPWFLFDFLGIYLTFVYLYVYVLFAYWKLPSLWPLKCFSVDETRVNEKGFYVTNVESNVDLYSRWSLFYTCFIVGGNLWEGKWITTIPHSAEYLWIYNCCTNFSFPHFRLRRNSF